MTALPPYLVASKGGSLVSVFVQPKAAKNEIVGLHGDALKVKVKAAPEDGKANAAVCELLAKTVGVRTREAEVVSGGASRFKRIAIPIAPEAVVTAVELVLSSGALGGPKGDPKGGPEGGDQP